MKNYFHLQYKIILRKLKDWGLPAWLSVVILLIAFIAFATYLFTKSQFASYIFVFVALTLIFRLSEAKKNDFLISIFNKQQYLKLRIIENIILSSPFVIFLFYKSLFLLAGVLCLSSILLALFRFSFGSQISIPTPFSKRPFEFSSGFRNTYFVFLIAYLMCIVAIVENNFNLGMFSLGLIAMISCSFYFKPEKELLVWNFSCTPNGFLLKKCRESSINYSLLALPVMIALSIFFIDNIAFIIGLYALGFVYIVAIILAKYATYPSEINLIQGFILAMSFIFPPIMIAIVPFFYYQSIKKLNPILND